MKTTCHIVAAVMFLTALPSVALEREAKPDGPPDRVLKKGDWEFRVFYRAKGSRSEGQHGVLIHKGNVVPPGKKDEELATAFGIIVYYGNTYELPWTPTGWNFKDKAKILSSWKKKHPAEQSPAGDSKNRADGTVSGTPEE